MVAIIKYLVFAAGLTALRARQTVAAVLSDTQTLTSSSNNLTTALNNYDGTVGGFGLVSYRINLVLSTLKKANADVQNTPTANDADSSTIINYINNTLEPAINTDVIAFINQKTKFITAGLKAVIQGEISYLKGNATTWGNSVVVKISSSRRTAASAAISKIIADFNRLQSAYA